MFVEHQSTSDIKIHPMLKLRKRITTRLYQYGLYRANSNCTFAYTVSLRIWLWYFCFKWASPEIMETFNFHKLKGCK